MLKNKKFIDPEKGFLKKLQKALSILIIALLFLGSIPAYLLYQEISADTEVDEPIKNIPINSSSSEATSLVSLNTLQPTQEPDTSLLAEGKGVEIVRANCTPCHSAKLIVQNRATREGWLSMIRWMQQTQNLWDLGPNEEIILEYLSTHYPPEEKGRRENLKDIEWYVLEE
jgi:hypothetical protein